MIVNQTKHMYWRMMLTAVILLAFSSTSPTAMEPQTIGSGSSASHHVLGVDQSGAQVKRRLRPNAEMSDNIDGDAEEREFSLARQMKNLVESMSTTDHYQNLAKNTDYVPKRFVEGEMVEVINLLKKLKTEKNLLLLIAMGKNSLSYKVYLRHVENGLMMRWFLKGQLEKILFQLKENSNDPEHFIKFLKRPIWTFWIKNSRDGKKGLVKRMFDVLAKIEPPLNDKLLATLFFKARSDPETKPIAKELVKLQRKMWMKPEYDDANTLYKLLQLDKDGVDAIKSGAWSAWVWHLIDLAKAKNQSPTADIPALVLHELRKTKSDDFIRGMITAAQKANARKDFADKLEKKLEPKLTLENNS